MRMREESHRQKSASQLEMTPMIDIVFQLLVFFIMTFKIVDAEGDFNVKMPLGRASGPAVPSEVLPLRVRLTANDDGELASIELSDNSFRTMGELNRYIVNVVGTHDASVGMSVKPEVVIESDYHLHYKHVIAAVTAVSGTIENDEMVPLVETIKFTPPKIREL